MNLIKNNYLFALILLLLVFYFLFSLLEIFNVGALYGDQRRLDNTTSSGLGGLDETVQQLRFWYYFFVITCPISAIALLFTLYYKLKPSKLDH